MIYDIIRTSPKFKILLIYRTIMLIFVSIEKKLFFLKLVIIHFIENKTLLFIYNEKYLLKNICSVFYTI